MYGVLEYETKLELLDPEGKVAIYPVDTYRDRNKYRVLISLRETKNRGDIVDFHIDHTIKDGFTRSVEDYQVDRRGADQEYTKSIR